MKTVLVIGSGAREHALAWKLAQSPQVAKVIVAPGNPGMSDKWEYWPVSLSEGQAAFEKLAERAKTARVDLTVVGPDDPLALGIVNVFESHGLLAFGPRKAAAQIEASKAFAKEVMVAAQVPTAKYWAVTSEEEARKVLKSVPWGAGRGWVVKADGLALGKGVRVCSTQAEALEAVQSLILNSGRLVIEEKLLGEEISWMAICDGERCALLEPARDYKRIGDGDQGPNTGGMGAFSPVPGISTDFAEKIRNEVFLPTLKELSHRNVTFKGILYAGLMVDFATEKYWVLEFNARFGDPEAEVLLPRMDVDLYEWLAASAKGDLSALPKYVPFKKEHAVYVVAAAKGYPDQPEKGQAIHINGTSPKDCYFYAGVTTAAQGLKTSGGRVMGALGMGEDLASARDVAYRDLKKIQFDGMQYRSDIARLGKRT